MANALADPVTQETLDEITRVTKAATSGITVSTGFAGVDLSGVVSLVPANTPTYDRMTRVAAPQGAAAATWRSSLNVNNSQPNPFSGDDNGGGFVVFSEHDMLAPFRPVRVTGNVTQDAIDKARGYDDAKARATAGTLIQWRIAENKAIIGGNAVPLPTIGTVTVTAGTASGTLTASTAYYVKVAARSGANYYWGGSGAASNSGTVTTGSGSVNSITASVPAVRGAVAYDWYVSATPGGAGTYYYVTTTSVNTATFTSFTAANQAIPSVLTMPGLYATAPTAVPGADTSSNPYQYNGLIASLTADYAATGSLTTYLNGDLRSGATIISNDGAKLTGSAQGIPEIDSLLGGIFATAQCGPTVLLMSPQQAVDVTNQIMGSTQASTFLPAGTDRTSLVGGASVGRYVNRTTTETVQIQVDPWFPPGIIAALTETVPYPDAGASNNFEVRTLREVSETPYGTSTSDGGAGLGPRFTWDCSSMESFLSRAPVTCGLLTNIAKS